MVERFIKNHRPDNRKDSRPGNRKDLFGIIDIVAITDEHTIGVQACAGSGLAAHRDKMLEHPEAVMRWVRCPSRKLELWAWRKLARKGNRIWFARREEVLVENGVIQFRVIDSHY